MCDGGGDIVDDIVSPVTSTVETAFDRFGDSITPGFDPILGNPFTGDEPIITPTGNWTEGTWQQLRDNGLTSNSEGIWRATNAVADKIATTIAMNYGASALGGAIGSGAEGAAGSAWDYGPGNVGDGAGSAWDFGPGNVSDGATWGGIPMEDYAYQVGNDVFRPGDLPFNPKGIDIAETNGGLGNLGSTGGEDFGALSNTNNMDLGSLNTNPSALETPDLSGATGTLDSGGAGLGDTTVGSLDTGGGLNPNSTGSSGVSGGLRFENGQTSAIGTSPTITPNSGTGATMSEYTPSSLGRLFDSSVDKFMQNPIQNSIKGLGTLRGMYSNIQNAEMMKKYAEQLQQRSDPFASQRGFYQGELKQTYDDPTKIYNSPQYQSLNNLFTNQIRARDAAMGRNSQYGSRSAELQDHFMGYLDNYRKQLAQLSGANANPGAGSGVAATMYGNAAQAKKNVGDILVGGLNSIFGSPSTT